MSETMVVGPDIVGETAPRSAHPSRAVAMFAIPLLLIAAICFGAELLPLPGPNVQDLAAALRPPVFAGGTWAHPLGTDQLGRDIAARVAHGGQLTFLIGLGGMLAGAVPGVLIGLVAGYRGRTVDTVLSRLIDAQLALPGMLLAIVVLVSAGRSLPALLVVLALISWARYARVVRAEALVMRDRPFVVSLRAAAVPEWRIVLRHILPNVGPTIVVIASLEVGVMILIESSLSFLSLGVVSPDISWGMMLADGRDQLLLAWWVAAFPGIAISVVVLLTTLLGDALRARLDPRLRRY